MTKFPRFLTIANIAMAVKVPRSTVSDALKSLSEKAGPISGR
jgi:hypothetical protein